MVYLTHQDSINRTLSKLAIPQVVISRKNKAKNVSENMPQATQNGAVKNNPSSPATSLSSKIHVRTINTVEPESRLIPQPAKIQSQVSAISQAEMRAMLKKYYFFDYFWNQNGRGFNNKFRVKVLTEKRW